MELKEIISRIEEECPPALAESYDNSCLQVGDLSQKVKKVLLCLDCTEAVVQEAIAGGYELVISHHPVIFTPLTTLCSSRPENKLLIELIKHGIALYCLHTNFDNMRHGVNQKIAEKLNLKKIRTLDPKPHLLKKLTVFTPLDYADVVKEALFSAGAGRIGNYEACSFSSKGQGEFKPLAGADPFLGVINQPHIAQEIKIEVVYFSWQEGVILANLRSAHPYEEISFDLTSLDNSVSSFGSGLIGVLPSEISTAVFMSSIKERFRCSTIRHTKIQAASKLRTVAVCGGAGSFLIQKAAQQGADVLVTADCKYHDFFKAEGRLTLLDIGHYESEQYAPEAIFEIFSTKMPKLAFSCSVVDTNPVFYF